VQCAKCNGKGPTTRVKRTKWQALAHKKYPKLYFVGGDGGVVDCYLVLSKCPHQQIKRWFYVLTDTREKAEQILQRWDKQRCNHLCAGAGWHSLWRLRL